MRNLEIRSSEIKGSNKNDPPYLKTQRYLNKMFDSGQWDRISNFSIYVIEINDQIVVLDGNHRLDFANQHDLPLNNIQLLENDDDLEEFTSGSGVAYKKIKKLEQLKRLLERRIH